MLRDHLFLSIQLNGHYLTISPLLGLKNVLGFQGIFILNMVGQQWRSVSMKYRIKNWCCRYCPQTDWWLRKRNRWKFLHGFILEMMVLQSLAIMTPVANVTRSIVCLFCTLRNGVNNRCTRISVELTLESDKRSCYCNTTAARQS